MFSCGDREGIILIEHNIDASLQPRQSERYRERAHALGAGLNLVVCVGRRALKGRLDGAPFTSAVVVDIQSLPLIGHSRVRACKAAPEPAVLKDCVDDTPASFSRRIAISLPPGRSFQILKSLST
jgi:hypothetical protein